MVKLIMAHLWNQQNQDKTEAHGRIQADNKHPEEIIIDVTQVLPDTNVQIPKHNSNIN